MWHLPGLGFERKFPLGVYNTKDKRIVHFPKGEASGRLRNICSLKLVILGEASGWSVGIHYKCDSQMLLYSPIYKALLSHVTVKKGIPAASGLCTEGYETLANGGQGILDFEHFKILDSGDRLKRNKLNRNG